MTPPVTTRQELVLAERALVLARLERVRMTRPQEDDNVNHSQASRKAGLASLRGRLGSALIGAGKAVAGREWLEQARRVQTASAPR